MLLGVLDDRLTTSPEAARAFRAGVTTLLHVKTGALQHFARALALDPTFAMAHAALALIGHESGAPVEVRTRLAMATMHARRATEAEQDQVLAICDHVAGDRQALVRHLGNYPGDGLVLSVAVPSLAFNGVTESGAETWHLVESCTAAQAGTWFHDGLLASVRAEQGRYDEALDLATRAMTFAPGAGHAAHARAHVHYGSGDHQNGLDWLDTWMRTDGFDSAKSVHFSWYAALYELSLGDLRALAERYRTQLTTAPDSDCRSLLDVGALVWRWRLTPGSVEVPNLAPVTGTMRGMLLQPENPTLGLRAAITLAASGDASGLRRLACWAESHEDDSHRTLTAPLATALRHLMLEQPEACAEELLRLRSRTALAGAQREIVEETLISALIAAQRYEEARSLVGTRVQRPTCRRDLWFRQSADGPPSFR